MKKVVSILCICLLAISCCALAGCTDKPAAIPADSSYIGTWTAVRAELKGVETDMKDALDGDKFIVILNQDGTACVENTEQTSSANWKITKDGVELTGETDLSFQTVGKQLKSNILGVTIYFDKTAY